MSCIDRWAGEEKYATLVIPRELVTNLFWYRLVGRVGEYVSFRCAVLMNT